MRICNISHCHTLVTVEGKGWPMAPGESIEFDYTGTIRLTLTHTYKSTALSQDEIARDDMDASLVSVWLAAHKPPYFHIVLSTHCQVTCTNDTVISIHREKIRPTYYCAYDRLFPEVSKGTAVVTQQYFAEKKAFTEHYNKAIGKNSRTLRIIILAILASSSVPLLILLFLVNWVAGVIALLLDAVVLGGIYLIIRTLTYTYNKIDRRIVLDGFEEQKIAHYYAKAKSGSGERYGLTVD